MRLWNAATGTEIGEPLRVADEDRVRFLAMVRDHDRDILAAVTGAGGVGLWDAATGVELAQRKQRFSRVGDVARTSIHAVARCADGRLVAVSWEFSEHGLSVWDLRTGQRIGEPLQEPAGWYRYLDIPAGEYHPGGGVDPPGALEKEVTALALLTHDSRTVAIIAGTEGRLRVRDIATGRIVRELVCGEGRAIVAIVAGIVEGRPITVTSAGVNDALVEVWDPLTGERIGELVAETYGLSLALGELGDGQAVVSGVGGDGVVRLWSPLDGREVRAPIRTATWRPMVAVGAMSVDRDIVVTADGDIVTIWDPTAAVARSGPGPPREHSGAIRAVALGSLDGRRVLVSADRAGAVTIRDSLTGKIVHWLPGDRGSIGAIAIGPLPDGEAIVVIGHSDGSVRFWSPTSGSDVVREEHERGVSAVVIGRAPDGVTVAVSGDKGDTLRVWDPLTAEPLAELYSGVVPRKGRRSHGRRP